MICWHCFASPADVARASNGITPACDCMICGGGPCQACIGRARTEKELELAARLRLDVRDMASYELTLEGAPTIKHRRLRLPKGVAA